MPTTQSEQVSAQDSSNTAPAVSPQMASESPIAPATPVVITQKVVDYDAVEAARKEEKQKLYGEQEKMRTRIKELEADRNQRMAPDERIQAQLVEAQKQIAEQAAKLEEDRKQWQQQIAIQAAQQRQLQMQAFAERRLREEISAGNELMIELVGGSSEAEIDASIKLAKDEFARQKQMFYERFTREQAAYVAQGSPAGVSVRVAPSPQDFPRPMNAQQPVEVGAGTPGYNAVIQELTTPEAIRSGAYGARRKELLQAVRNNGGAPPAGSAFANTPRQYAQVEQPQGLPTPPVYNPQYQRQPANPANLPPTPMHQQQQGGIQPQMPQQVQQLMQQPVVSPQGMPSDALAQARQLAIQTAQRHLGNPSAAPTNGVVSGPRTMPPANPQAAQFDGSHGMNRNT